MNIDLYHKDAHYELVKLNSVSPERYQIFKNKVYHATLVHYLGIHRFAVQHKRGRYELKASTITDALKEFLCKESPCIK